ncbi:MAG: GNAT family N-acetyltransferase [Chlamydiota bacterium]|nr:GNAT family N-acetyltransferase [Chlamydiota bacterium]
MQNSVPDTLLVREALRKDRSHIEKMLKESEVFSVEEVQCALEMFDAYIKTGPLPDEYVFECLIDHDNPPLGFICYGRHSLADRVFDLYWILVDRNRRLRGIGKSLIAHLDQKLKTMNARMVVAETSSRLEYVATRAFYRATGFNQVARVPDFYHAGDDMEIYIKNYE